jgi:hypothetical protein
MDRFDSCLGRSFGVAIHDVWLQPCLPICDMQISDGNLECRDRDMGKFTTPSETMMLFFDLGMDHQDKVFCNAANCSRIARLLVPPLTFFSSTERS